MSRTPCADHARRRFLDRSIKAMLGAGAIQADWRAYAETGSTSRAHPDELLSIEEYTRGRLKAGDVISGDNVDCVRDLLDPIRCLQVEQMGRRLTLAPTTTDLSRLIPLAYVDATLRNAGLATFDARGNVVTRDGKPWCGGNPFPNPKSALEVIAGHTLSWGRHDASCYVAREYDIDENGKVLYQYATVWAEMAVTGCITLEPRPYLPDMMDKLRLQSIFFIEPGDLRGTAYLSTWYYDQNRFPDLHGYLPSFRRVRRFPTNQRFESLNPGSELYLSDAWACGDPYLTWGNYRIIGRGPFLGGVSRGWNPAHPNWQHRTHGGPGGTHFWDGTVELVPDVFVIESEPVGFPRAPVGRKRIWFDARTSLPLVMLTFDRRGQPYRHFDCSYSLYADERQRIMDGRDPYWSWSAIHAFNVQTRRMTRIEQVREVDGGHRMKVNDPAIFDEYLTLTALQRQG